MKRMVVVVSLFVMLFVAVSPAFAGCPGCGGHRGGGFGQTVSQASQGVSRFAQRAGQTAQQVAGQIASDAKKAAKAAKKLEKSTTSFGDSARIGQALDNATSRAQGK